MDDLFATPREVTDVASCVFYHTMDLPGYGVVEGAWDLRKTADQYIGHFDPAGKRILEIGTASGFISFHMEKRGAAEVVGYDLGPGCDWDMMTGPEDDPEEVRRNMNRGIERLNNSYWLAHRALQSNCKMVYGNIYEVPEELGTFDAVVLCSVLMHVRDPILAVQRLAERCNEIVICERMPETLKKLRGPVAEFMPHPSRKKNFGGWTWWLMRPEAYEALLQLLGFEIVRREFSNHYYQRVDRTFELYTIVARKR